MKNFWLKLPKHFTALAPMSGVTDFPFREMVAGIGSPDIFFTEFISTEGVVRSVGNSHGYSLQYAKQMHFSKKQRPIIVQFFGSKPEQFEYCARLAVRYKFDGIDINMGCPDRKVLKQGAGSDLIKNPQLVKEIIQSAKKGCGGKLPISVKTRLGYDKKDLEWIRFLLSQDLDALTIHGRYAKQGYAGIADWDAIGEIVKMRDKMKLKTLIIGNGDVKDLAHGKILAEKYGVDGFMIGRQILHNLWVFRREQPWLIPTVRERVKIALKHTKLFEKFYGSQKDIGLMKKYYKAYFSGVSGDIFPKKELMECKNIKEAKRLLKH